MWFYFHLYMWVIYWGLLLRLPWRAWVCPCEGQVWRWCSCLGCRGSGSTKYSGLLAATAAENNSVLEGYRNQYWPIALQYSCLENPPDREAWQATVYRIGTSWTRPKQSCEHRLKGFFFVACGSSAPVRVEHEGGVAAWLVGTLAAPSVQGHGLLPPKELRPFQSLFLSLL